MFVNVSAQVLPLYMLIKNSVGCCHSLIKITNLPINIFLSCTACCVWITETHCRKISLSIVPQFSLKQLMQKESGGDTTKVVPFWGNIRNPKMRRTQEHQKKGKRGREDSSSSLSLLQGSAPEKSLPWIAWISNLSPRVSGLITWKHKEGGDNRMHLWLFDDRSVSYAVLRTQLGLPVTVDLIHSLHVMFQKRMSLLCAVHRWRLWLSWSHHCCNACLATVCNT